MINTESIEVTCDIEKTLRRLNKVRYRLDKAYRTQQHSCDSTSDYMYEVDDSLEFGSLEFGSLEFGSLEFEGKWRKYKSYIGGRSLFLQNLEQLLNLMTDLDRIDPIKKTTLPSGLNGDPTSLYEFSYYKDARSRQQFLSQVQHSFSIAFDDSCSLNLLGSDDISHAAFIDKCKNLIGSDISDEQFSELRKIIYNRICFFCWALADLELEKFEMKFQNFLQAYEDGKTLSQKEIQSLREVIDTASGYLQQSIIYSDAFDKGHTADLQFDKSELSI